MRFHFIGYIFFIFSLIFCFKVKAQYNDSTFHYLGFVSSGSLNKTNSSTAYLLNNALKMGIQKKDIALNSTNKFLYGDQNNKLTNKDFSSAWDLNLYKTFPHFYYWGLFVYNSNYSLRINNQLLTGVGIAYKFIDQPTRQINVSNGILFDYSDIQLNDSTRDIYGTPRNSFRLQIKWDIKNLMVFRGNAFIQNSLQDVSDYIFKSDVSLSIKIKKWLSLTSALTYNQMTRTKKENLFVTYGLTVEKYF